MAATAESRGTDQYPMYWHNFRDEGYVDVYQDGAEQSEKTSIADEQMRTEPAVDFEDDLATEQVDPEDIQDHPQHHFAEDEDEEVEEEESSDEEGIDGGVQADMEKLQADFPGFRKKYRLIKRIGEVYKAEDVCYDDYNNSWDYDNDAQQWRSPPLKKSRTAGRPAPRRKPHFVAVKKIYVTSSPERIFNELDLLFDLRGCRAVCPLITAFRHTDQVVAVLPYHRHADFRSYFRDMTVPDIAVYLRCLFTALESVHEKKILHRDIKPTNFLYDPSTQHGVLVDFGLAEREGMESKPCLCHESRDMRKRRQMASVWAKTTASGQPIQHGYPRSDTRPSRRANRAGTRGFRAPEVLFKCTEQTTAIDVWSVGVILLTILSRRFPFFHSPDDVEATIEIATIFGTRRMKAAALLHGCVFETSIPTVSQQGFSMEKIIAWSTCRTETNDPLSDDEKLAINFLDRCMDLDPSRRITAQEALQHEFLAGKESMDLDDEDGVDVLQV